MYQTMANSDKRRILGALTCKKTDRVPNFEVLVDDPTLRYVMGREIRGSHTLDNIDIGDYMEFARRVGQDAVGLCFYDNPFRVMGEDGTPMPRDFRITCRKDLERLMPATLDHLEGRFRQLAQYREATMRRIWVPRMKRMMAPATESGIPILFHSDGNIIEMLPDLLEMGIGGLNPIEPYGMDISDVKKRFGANIALFGNLDVGAVLAMGTPDTVRAAARNLIDTVGKDGGLVMASSHSITADVHPENYIAMIDSHVSTDTPSSHCKCVRVC